MSWTTPATFTTGQLIGASDLNTQLRDNMNYLLGGWPLGYVNRDGVSDYSLTNTSFADTDAANLILSMVLAGTRALVWVALTAANVVNSTLEFDVIANSTTRAGGTDGVISGGRSGVSGLFSYSVLARFTGLTPGTNTFKLQSRTVGAGTYTIYNNAQPITMLGWGF